MTKTSTSAVLTTLFLIVATVGTSRASYAVARGEEGADEPSDCAATWIPNLGSPFTANGWAFSEVHALVVHETAQGTRVHGAGTFRMALTNVPTLGVASWDGVRWVFLGGEANGRILALRSYQGANGPILIAGGEFTEIGGVQASRVAIWDGLRWAPLGRGISGGAAPTVDAVAVYDDGLGDGPVIYAGGHFSKAGEVFVKDIARWDGERWSRLGSEPLSHVRALEVFDEGHGGGPALFVGSSLPLQRWDGSIWTQVPLGPSFVRALLAVAEEQDTALYVGGNFTLALPSGTGGSVVRWDGSMWTLTSPSISGSVWCLARIPSAAGAATLFAGGPNLDLAGFGQDNHIARLADDRWYPLESGLGNHVNALAVEESAYGPRLYAGGSFEQVPVNGQFVAAWGCPGPPVGNAFCLGDGSETSCPCGNLGSPGHGCENAHGTGGVRIRAAGGPLPRNTVITGTGFPPFSTVSSVLLASRFAALVPTSFGDGLACLDRPIVRVGADQAIGGQVSFDTFPNANSGLFHYQVWYRSEGNFCAPASFNLSNALTILWP